MNCWLYRLLSIVFLGVNLTGIPSILFAQDHMQMNWSLFEASIDSLSLGGKQEIAFDWLAEREKQALQTENWEEALGCVNKYSRLVEIPDPELRIRKILSSWWLANKITSPSPEKALFIQQVGEVYMTDPSKKDSANFFHQQARKDFRLLQMWEDYAYATILTGINHYYDGKYDEAEVLCLLALDSATTYLEKDNSAIATALHVLGVIATTTGDFDRSLLYSQQTLAVYEQMESMTVIDSQFLGTLYSNRGFNLLEMEDFDQALAHFQKSQFILRKLSQSDPTDLIAATINEGIIYWKVGEKEKAHSIWINMVQQMEMQTGYDKDRLMNTVYSYLSEYYAEKGDYSTALDYLKRANKLESIERSVTVQTILDMGKVYRNMGKLDEAKKWIERAIKEAEVTQQSRSTLASLAYLELSKYYETIDEKEKALAEVQHAIVLISDTFDNVSVASQPLIQQVPDKWFLLKLLQQKANICEALFLEEEKEGWLTLSASTYDLAINLIDTIRANFRTEGSKLRFAEVAHRVYDGAIQVTLIRHQKNPDPLLLKKAFSYAEKNKGLALREALQNSDAKKFAGIPTDLLERERKLTAELAFYRKKIFDGKKGGGPDSAKIGLWQNKHFELRKAFLALIDILEHKYEDYYKLKYRDESIDADAIMGGLTEGKALVEYFWGEEELVVFYLTADSIQVFEQPLNDEFLENLNTCRLALTQKPGENAADFVKSYADFSENAYTLYQLLLPPLLANANVHDLIIIPDGMLGYLPFEVLLTERASMKDGAQFAQLPYLFKDCKIRYEYAAAFLAHTYAGKGKGNGLIGFAPVYGEQPSDFSAYSTRSDWRPLVYNQEELQHISQQMDGKAYVGAEATKSRFLAEAPSYTILHMAMHGFMNDQDPLYSGLVFSAENQDQDTTTIEFLHAYELYSISLQAELAVLSACHTGSGQLVKGEGIMSMARAFRYAGCPSIVMSLWTADDRATIRLMEYFYEYLEEGLEKHAALQKARSAYLGSTRRDHPYYWAGFVLIGDEHVLSTNNSPRKYLWIGGGGILLLFLLWGMRKTIRKQNR